MTGTRALALAALAAIVLVSAWIARAVEGARAIADCDAAFSRGDRVEAIVLARVAAEARCPRCAAPELAYVRLEAIAKGSEASGDDVTAALAWRAVRSAALASVVLDGAPAWRERAEPEIARLEHRLDQRAVGAGTEAAASPAAAEDRIREVLARTGVPGGALFAVLAAGSVLFVAGVIRFVRARAFRAPDLALAVAGLAVAVVGALAF